MSKEKCHRKTESSILTGRKGILSPITMSCEVASNIRSKRVSVTRGITAPNTRKQGITTKILGKQF